MRRRRVKAGARARRRGAVGVEQVLLPHHDLCHISILAPELGVHTVLTRLVVTKLATPAATLRAVVGGAKPAKPRVVKLVVTRVATHRAVLGGARGGPGASAGKGTGG